MLENEINALVTIPISILLDLTKKAEQRDIILRYVIASEYSITKKEILSICGEKEPPKETDL